VTKLLATNLIDDATALTLSVKSAVQYFAKKTCNHMKLNEIRDFRKAT